MIAATMMPSAGTATSSSADNCTSWCSARMMPPTHMIGAATIIVKVISASICTCWTSFVLLVIRDGAPKWPTSLAENCCTFEKTAIRTSLPSAIAVRAPKYTAPIAHTIWTSATASMSPPVRRM